MLEYALLNAQDDKITGAEQKKEKIKSYDFLQNLTHQLSDALKLGKTSPYIENQQCTLRELKDDKNRFVIEII